MRLFHTIVKEALLLARDRGGLALLFIMPTALVFIVTLIQEDAYKAVNASTSPVLFVNRDQGRFGADLEKGLIASRYFQVIESLDGKPLTAESARDAVSRGEYQICVVVPGGATAKIEEAIGRKLQGGETKGTTAGRETVAELTVFYDPAIRETHRQALASSVERISLAIETRMFFDALAEMMGGMAPSPGAGEMDLVSLREEVAGGSGYIPVPSSVQQNVPGWTLFAMFMIVIPLSGSIIKEREGGTLVRLRTLPISDWTILSGKVIVYVLVCLFQFALMLWIGVRVMPLLGLQRLEIGPHWVALGAAALASALAATGFGIMTGTLARTHDQASVFGSTFVVIAGAVGGIMVPTFLMPQGMKALSVWSPLNWGMNAFLDIFLRGGDLGTIRLHLLRLTAFFAGTMLTAVVSFWHRD